MGLFNISDLTFLLILGALLTVAVVLMRFGKQWNLGETQGDRVSSSDFQALVQAGNRYFQEYHYQEALKCFQMAMKLNNRDPMLHYRIGRIYQTLEDHGQAQIAFANVVSLTPESIEALFELSRCYFHLKKNEKSLETLDRLFALNPDYDEALRLKIRVLIELSRFQEACEMLEILTEKEPQNLDFKLLLGKTYQKAQQWEKALELYQTLLKQDLHDRKNLKFEVYKIYCKLGQMDEAIETLQDILDTGSGTISRDDLRNEMAKCWCRKAMDAYSAMDYEQALEHYHVAASICPDNPEIYTGIGRVHATQGQNEEAVGCYRKALELGHENTQTYVELATVYEHMDQFKLAIECMIKAEDLMPTAEILYYLGTLYGLDGDLQRCVDYLRKATNKDPKHIDPLYNLAVALEQQKKFSDARECYKKVLDLDKSHVQAKANYKMLKTRKW